MGYRYIRTFGRSNTMHGTPILRNDVWIKANLTAQPNDIEICILLRGVVVMVPLDELLEPFPTPF